MRRVQRRVSELVGRLLELVGRPPHSPYQRAQLNAIVGEGNMRMNDLVRAMSTSIVAADVDGER